MIVLALLLNVALIVAAIVLLLHRQELPGYLSGVIPALFLAPFAAFILIRFQYWSTIANGVEVTSKQFPEIWGLLQELFPVMGFTADAPRANDRIPRVYLVNGNGVMNAFASKCAVTRGYVVLHSDLVDTAYDHGNIEGLRFVLAHELAHIKCGHVSIWRTILHPALALLRLDTSLTRAQEYTADRTAAFVSPHGALEVARILYAGKHMGARMDLDEYMHSMTTHKDGIWLRIVNLLSSHAVGFRRMEALRAASQGQWDVHGRML
ncbi:M48 family metallopeptidase [Actinomyces capricornis]|uniref:Peptidase M48 domain-containing protein n=1 Tax=Actinomyces capricornis TaxID=2755559 RepID=A0ABM7U9F0_9ACTO|nr:M48 family metallopeptidase [Actinomyces capricornis]BDA63972.1 hypothetical protein MANAM107_08060 [Actinomyces capricornis]